MTKLNRILHHIWLAQSFPYGSIKPKQIASKFDTNLDEFCNNLDKYAEEFDLTSKRLMKLKSKKPIDFLNIISRCKHLNIKIVCFFDEHYPKKLRDLDSSPVVIYYVGDLSIVDKPTAAIVGTRRASLYGLTTAKKIAIELADNEIVVVSGCADGIDSSAHRGIVEVKKPTVAILGTPIEKPYPLRSGHLKRQIVELGGLIISEYAPGTEIFPWLFPIRNRLIVGLSDVIIIVESPKKSGAMITANIACDYGKEIFCVPPSNIFSNNNDGIKKILRDGANLLLDTADVLKSYKFSNFSMSRLKTNISELQNVKNNNTFEIPSHLRPLFNLIGSDFDLDLAVSKLNYPVHQILEMLTELEIRGLIKKFGVYYKKI